MPGEPRRVAVLFSGGLDSSTLVAELVDESAEVWPVRVECNLGWEAQELSAAHAFLEAIARPNLKPLVMLQAPVSTAHADHWSVSGRGVPDSGDPLQALTIPGRNIVLIGTAAVWCCGHGVHEIAIGTLAAADEGFPDASPQFFDAYGHVLSTGLDHRIDVVAPYRGLTKVDVIRRNARRPLDLSLTCISPRHGMHCGHCKKCAERRTAFHEAGVPDRTSYASG